jgi:ATP-binding cassette subfamily F protein uup
LILVSHDRAFLNNVVTSTIVLDGKGAVDEFAGGYDDWLALRPVEEQAAKSKLKDDKQSVKVRKPGSLRKLSFKEKQELQDLPARIEKMEAEQEKLYTLLADINFYKGDPKEVDEAEARSESLGEEIFKAYERWEELEGSQDQGV